MKEVIKKVWAKIVYYGVIVVISLIAFGIIALFWWLDHIRFIY